MVKIIKGDLLKSQSEIIAHQVNCLGVMGSGVAKQIREKYPEVYDEYIEFCVDYSDKSLLGMTQAIKTTNGRIVVNLFGQNDYGRDGKQYTDIDALRQCFNSLYTYALRNDIKTIAMPYKIGCGLGGGDWEEVLTLILSVFKDVDVELWRI